MPSNLGGAYVDYFSKGKNYEEATKNALDKLVKDGLYPEEILEPILVDQGSGLSVTHFLSIT